MKKIFKNIFSCLALILAVSFVNACGQKEDTNENVNTGITFESFDIVGSALLSSRSLSTREILTINDENPFGSNKKTLEEKLQEEIDIGEQFPVHYNAQLNESVLAIVTIDNPSNKVIASITINGSRYTSNSFENGSNKEKVIIKLSVGNKIEIKSYTLETIQYIDGSSAKEIEIKENATKLVKVGNIQDIGYRISDVYVSDNSLGFNLYLVDNYSLISKTKGFISAVLYDGDNLIKKTLSVASQIVMFDDLSPNTKYQYAIIATYDKLDGDRKKHYILESDIITTEALIIEEYTITKSTIVNGTITVENIAQEGSIVNVGVTPNTGYQLKELYYIKQGSTVKHKINNNTFTMPANDITIYATFEEIAQVNGYTITVVEVINGTLEIASSAQADDLVDFIATPNPGYKLSALFYLEDGDDVETYFGGDCLLMPQNNISIYVYFEKAYTISVADIINGEISVDELGIEDESIEIDVTADTGYKLKELYYIEEGDTSKNLIEESFFGLEFDMPANNITIYAVFEEILSSEAIVINNKQDLINLSMTEEDWNKNISLRANIDLEGIEWTPIGNYETPFEGIFNGNGYTISNFKITNEFDYVGLFGYVEYGTIKDLKITNYLYTLDYSDSFGKIYIGGLVASINYGNIEKNYSSGDISVLGNVNVFVGGLIGEAVDTSINNSYTNGNITGTLSGYMIMAGGLVGNMEKDDFFEDYYIIDSYSTMNISMQNIDDDPGYFQINIGGLVGMSDYNISNSYAIGNVSATSNNFPTDSMWSIEIGGLIGTTGVFAEVDGYQLSSQEIFASDSEYTIINNDGSKATLTEILSEINDSLLGWDNQIWNLNVNDHPTLK